MKKSLPRISKPPVELISPDETSLFTFIRSLRLSIRARVAAEQSRGIGLAEIAIHVREMVKVTDEAASHSASYASPAFRSITRQAEGWCLEAYRDARGNKELPTDRYPQESPT